MTLESWKSIFEIGGLIALLLTFIFGGGAWVTTNSLNKRQDAQLRSFNERLTEARTELGKQQVRAANAEHALAEVNNTAGSANEKAGLAVERAAKLEKAKFELEIKAEELRKANLDLEATLSPRLFDDQDGAAKALRPFVPISAAIEYLPDLECSRTAEQINFTLQQAGWQVIKHEAANAGAKFFDGVIVQVSDDLTPRLAGTPQGGAANDELVRRWRDTRQLVKHGSAAADTLVGELNKTHIGARTSAVDDAYPTGTIVVRIGMKPIPPGRAHSWMWGNRTDRAKP
jgi:hypothetical protein